VQPENIHLTPLTAKMQTDIQTHKKYIKILI